jgi:long-chain acyl-CoA synthetase
MTTGTEQLYREKGDTWPKVLKYNYGKYGDTHRAMRHKHHGIWRPYTWKDYYFNVKSLALGLISLGLEPGDKMLIVGDNAPEWYYAALAAQAGHGVSVGAYSDLTPTEMKYIAENSDARFALVQDQEQVDKLLQIKDEIPLLKKVIYWRYKGLAHYDDPLLVGYRDVLELGRKFEKEHPGLFERMVETGNADDVCALVYTSGTTGDVPKGVIHTYRTLRASVDSLLRLTPWHKDDNAVPYLPPAWVTEHWFGIGCHLLSASTLNFAEAPQTQQRDTTETRPSIISYGARLWESQAAMVQARISTADAFNRTAFRLLMPVGYMMADLKFRKEKAGLGVRVLHWLADIALFKSIRASLGLSNARICYSTGAILSPDAFRFYHALNVPLRSVYGTTEGGVLTCASDDDMSLETLGPVPPGKELRISAEGEIVCGQPGVCLGYYKDPEKSAEVLQDGWFYSGDSGFIKEDGHLVFVDRLKDLVEMASGDKLAPQFVENRLRFSPYIKDAWMLSGPEGLYASAIIVINYDHVGSWAGERKVPYSTFTELAQRPEVYELVKQDIDRVNRTLSPGSRVRKYINLHREFDPDEGELTRNRKLRRVFLEERYRDLIEAIYSGKPEVVIEARVGTSDGRMGTITTTLRIQSVEGDG